MLEADFCIVAVLISFGAVIGKASLSQLIIMATIEVLIQNANRYICLHYFEVLLIKNSNNIHPGSANKATNNTLLHESTILEFII